MNQKYTCYCGLTCENCACKVKVEPAAKVLYAEMKSWEAWAELQDGRRVKGYTYSGKKQHD